MKKEINVKKWLISLIGYLTSGLFVMTVWGALFEELGLMGGMIASGLIIGFLWQVNHFDNIAQNHPNKIFIDIAVSIGIAGIIRDILTYGGSEWVKSFPTFITVITGGIIGGWVTTWVERKE